MSYAGLLLQGYNPPIGLPSYASGVGTWSPDNSRYNVRSNNKFSSRMALGNAIDGSGFWDIGFIGASLSLGFNGNGLTQDSTKSWPTQFVKEIAYLMGGIPTLEGVIPLGGQTDRWALTGGASSSSAPAYVFSVGAGTATGTQTGTDIWIEFWNGNVGTSTVQVDANAAVNLVPAGGNTWQLVHVATGLANTAHTVKFTSTAGQSCIWGMSTATGAASSGIRYHNLCLGGTSAAFGTQYTNWSDHTSQGVSQIYLSDARFKFMADMGFVPQTWFIDLPYNDPQHGVTVAQAIAGLNDIESRLPLLPTGRKPDVFYIGCWPVNITQAAWAPYQSAVYQHCDATDPVNFPNGRGLWDWNDVIGGLANGIATNSIGPDGIHASWPNMEAFGKGVALPFLA